MKDLGLNITLLINKLMLKNEEGCLAESNQHSYRKSKSLIIYEYMPISQYIIVKVYFLSY